MREPQIDKIGIVIFTHLYIPLGNSDLRVFANTLVFKQLTRVLLNYSLPLFFIIWSFNFWSNCQLQMQMYLCSFEK